jgi:hypothetical protein
MANNARDPLFDLFCMAYVPPSAIARDGPRKSRGEEESDGPHPARPKASGLMAAAAAIVAVGAAIGLAQISL